jgi:hypothetical protein
MKIGVRPCFLFEKRGVAQQCPVRKLLAKKIGKKISIEAFFS